MELQAAPVARARVLPRLRPRWDPAQLALYGLVLGALGLLIVAPVASVLRGALVEGGRWTLAPLGRFLHTPLYLESLCNSLWVGILATALASLLGVPVAFLVARYEFPGRTLLLTLATLPLVIPPFVGAIGLNQTLGRAGTLTLLLEDLLGVRFVLAEGLRGVALAHALHYFPFILLTVTNALHNLDPTLEEAALVLGARGWRLMRRVVFPLVLPAYLAGAILVFVRATDDLGTPLILNVKNMLALKRTSASPPRPRRGLPPAPNAPPRPEASGPPRHGSHRGPPAWSWASASSGSSTTSPFPGSASPSPRFGLSSPCCTWPGGFRTRYAPPLPPSPRCTPPWRRPPWWRVHGGCAPSAG